MVWASQFRANGCAHGPAHGRHATHTDVRTRLGGHPEGRQVAPAATSVVDGDGLITVDHLHQVIDYPIAIGRHRCIGEDRHPVTQPLGAGTLNLCGYLWLDAPLTRPKTLPHCRNEIA